MRINLAITPQGMIEPMSYYICGDIYPKIQALTEAIGREPDDRLRQKFQKQIEAMRKKQKNQTGRH